MINSKTIHHELKKLSFKIAATEVEYNECLQHNGLVNKVLGRKSKQTIKSELDTLKGYWKTLEHLRMGDKEYYWDE